MKKIIIIFVFLVFVPDVQASEIMGNITTDPKGLPSQNETSTTSVITNSEKSGGAVPFYLLSKNNNTNSAASGDIKVMGVEKYPDHSLLRTADKKIYLVAGRYRKAIISLAQLKRYSGQPIYDVSDDVVEQYGKIGGNWQLIKERGKTPVYVIKNGRKIWIPNWAEFKRYFSGEKIFEITDEEMKLFE